MPPEAPGWPSGVPPGKQKKARKTATLGISNSEVPRPAPLGSLAARRGQPGSSGPGGPSLEARASRCPGEGIHVKLPVILLVLRGSHDRKLLLVISWIFQVIRIILVSLWIIQIICLKIVSIRVIRIVRIIHNQYYLYAI